MAALPYMRMYWADYDADTSHLSAMQHGIYLLLIKNYWQRGGPLPDDETKLARIAKVNLKDWRRNEAVILEFFTKRESLLYHTRIALELSRVEAKSLKAKESALANAKRTQSKRSANGERTPIYTEADKIPLDKESNGEKRSEEDAQAIFWKSAKAWLKPRVKGDPGALINKWLREHGKESTQAAVNAAQLENAVDPPAYVAGYFRRHAAAEESEFHWDGGA
jgi:uncharacterized protein YdaU (DUF1376 family)